MVAGVLVPVYGRREGCKVDVDELRKKVQKGGKTSAGEVSSEECRLVRSSLRKKGSSGVDMEFNSAWGDKGGGLSQSTSDVDSGPASSVALCCPPLQQLLLSNDPPHQALQRKVIDGCGAKSPNAIRGHGCPGPGRPGNRVFMPQGAPEGCWAAHFATFLGSPRSCEPPGPCSASFLRGAQIGVGSSRERRLLDLQPRHAAR